MAKLLRLAPTIPAMRISRELPPGAEAEAD